MKQFVIRGKIHSTDNKWYEFGGKDGIMLKWTGLLLIPKIRNNLIGYNVIL